MKVKIEELEQVTVVSISIVECQLAYNPANINRFKVNYVTPVLCEICSKLTIKTS